MKIITREYELQNPLLTHNYTYINISDIHSNYKALLSIKEIINNIKPDFLVMTGDIVDSINHKDNNKLFEVINSLSKEYPIFISYGNHDCVNSLKRHEMTGDYTVLNKIDCNKAQILANRGFYKINNDLCIESFNTKSMDWYYEHHENTNLFMEEFINEYKPQPNTFKILLSHSPNPYFDENNIFINNSLLDNTVINCGHNHGGFVLPFFQDKLIHKKKYGIGLVGPYHRLFTHHAYGFYSNMQSSLIINNAVTKWSDCNGHLMGNIVNSILKPEIDIIHLKPGEVHELNYLGRKKV